MSEAEFERRAAVEAAVAEVAAATLPISSASSTAVMDPEPTPRVAAATSRTRVSRGKPTKPKRVQRMFALEEDLDKKLWLYAIHVGKDRSEVINDLLRPLVASMVLYDSRDRRSARTAEITSEGQGSYDDER
jgi:hypothetical protein